MMTQWREWCLHRLDKNSGEERLVLFWQGNADNWFTNTWEQASSLLLPSSHSILNTRALHRGKLDTPNTSEKTYFHQNLETHPSSQPALAWKADVASRPPTSKHISIYNIWKSECKSDLCLYRTTGGPESKTCGALWPLLFTRVQDSFSNAAEMEKHWYNK